MFQIDKKFPDFALEIYNPENKDVGKIKLNDFAGGWLILFFYPADFTFVCPTELLDINRKIEGFKKLNAEIVSVSTDTVFTHKAWLETEELLKDIKYKMAADHNGKFSRELGIYDEEIGMAQRAVFIVDPEGILRSAQIVADAIGRNASEILRQLKALDFVKNNPGHVCPASWDEGAQTLEPHVSKAGRVYKELK
ncbi:peroxiredoxin [Candidatus Giovannonibacteria bacterium]|nr:peroxiredoxin [Candidatus Giovannonibacteria bacterium]